MSAVSKRVIPELSAAATTSAVPARPMRPPKLLQPSPTTLTVSDPMRRVSIGVLLPSAGSHRRTRLEPAVLYRRALVGEPDDPRRVRGESDGSRRSGRVGGSGARRGLGEGG